VGNNGEPTGRVRSPLVGRSVSFRLLDVFMPPASELLSDLCGSLVVEGEVVDESRGPTDRAAPGGEAQVDPGQAQDHVVVRLAGLERLVVVSRSRIRLVPAGPIDHPTTC
jgi:hypothetical protein